MTSLWQEISMKGSTSSADERLLPSAQDQTQNACMRWMHVPWGFAAAALFLTLAAAPQSAPPKTAIPPPEARVDINHASVEQLLKVPGMTRSWAGRIIRFRPYRTKQDLLDRGVLSTEVYDRIREHIIARQRPQ